jgi:hypothetical protein
MALVTPSIKIRRSQTCRCSTRAVTERPGSGRSACHSRRERGAHTPAASWSSSAPARPGAAPAPDGPRAAHEDHTSIVEKHGCHRRRVRCRHQLPGQPAAAGRGVLPALRDEAMPPAARPPAAQARKQAQRKSPRPAGRERLSEEQRAQGEVHLASRSNRIKASRQRGTPEDDRGPHDTAQARLCRAKEFVVAAGRRRARPGETHAGQRLAGPAQPG